MSRTLEEAILYGMLCPRCYAEVECVERDQRLVADYSGAVGARTPTACHTIRFTCGTIWSRPGGGWRKWCDEEDGE